jgi:hypothetical protein
MALHLLRTLERDHTEDSRVAPCLIPSEGHHIDHTENDPVVYIETAYPMSTGCNWWVTHFNGIVTLQTETGQSVTIPFNDYKTEVIRFVTKVEDFYTRSNPKNLPDSKYDREAYLKFWNEWHSRRQKWKKF